MPWSPPSPCAASGCPELTSERYCPRHQRQHQARVRDDRKGKPWPEREKTAARGYGSRWRTIRNRKIQQDPWCEICYDATAAAERLAMAGSSYRPMRRERKWTPATEVDHMRSLSDGGDNSTANLMSICRTCHSRKTAFENRESRNG